MKQQSAYYWGKITLKEKSHSTYKNIENENSSWKTKYWFHRKELKEQTGLK